MIGSCQLQYLIEYLVTRFLGGRKALLFKNIPGSFTEAVLCSISEPALIYDSDLKITWTNPSAELFFGHSTEFMTGNKCLDLFQNSLECFQDCPVSRSFASWRKETLLVDGVVRPNMLIKAIPYKEDDKRFVLAIIHSIPDIDRNKALRRDFAALLNQSATLEEALQNIINVMRTLTSVSVCGVYTKSGEHFRLLRGDGAPEFILDADFTSPSYVSQNRLPFDSRNSFPNGIAVVPVTAPGRNTRELLFVGKGTLGTKNRNRLEMIASVLAECIARLTSS